MPSTAPVGALWGPGLDGEVGALHVHDFGAGPRLVAGGRFATADGVAVNRIASFDAVTWSALGAGIELGGPDTDRGVNALIVDSSIGSGSRLVAASRFRGSTGVSAPDLIAFDGVQWGDFSQGLGPTFAGGVDVMASFEFGQGLELVAGGRFSVGTSVGSNLARRQGGGMDPIPLGTRDHRPRFWFQSGHSRWRPMGRRKRYALFLRSTLRL